MRQSFTVGVGGAAGQGVATPGDIFAKIFSRRGLHLNAYNAYQSIIRGGHTFLTIRTGPDKISNMGDRVDLLIPLNQDTMDRHLGLLSAGGACLYIRNFMFEGDREGFLFLGSMGVALGLGSLLSAIAALVVARMWGQLTRADAGARS